MRSLLFAIAIIVAAVVITSWEVEPTVALVQRGLELLGQFRPPFGAVDPIAQVLKLGGNREYIGAYLRGLWVLN